MIYLVFSCLFILGAVAALILARLSYRKTEVRVLESREKLSVKENEFSSITLKHAIEIPEKPGEIIITDAIPVHEPDDTRITVNIDKRTGQPVKTPILSFVTIPGAMFLAGLVCLGLFFLDKYVDRGFYANGLDIDAGLVAKGAVALFAGLFVLYLLKDVFYLLNPNVVRVRGKYEGFMHSGQDHRLTAYYSLWYGEYRQFARCLGAPVKAAVDKKEHTLFFNTKKCTVIRKADVIRNICLAVLFTGTLVLLAV